MMQWADLNISALFGSTIPVPATLQQRQFRRSNPKKKHMFQELFGSHAARHKLADKIAVLESDFKALAAKPGAELERNEFDNLVKRYNALDLVIADSMKGAVNAVFKADKG